jgi:hypothetical protein
MSPCSFLIFNDGSLPFLIQSLLFQGLLHGRPRSDAGLIFLKGRPSRQIEFKKLGPISHREQIGIRYLEILAKQVRPALQHLGNILIAPREIVERRLLLRLVGSWIKQQAVLLVDFGGDEI